MTFAKNPRVDDVWFHPSRVLDSHPWDKTQLQESITQFHQVFGSYCRRHHWLLSEGTKFNPVGVGATSAHEKWLTMLIGISCDMWEKTEMPVILYSKLPDPTYLSTLGKSHSFTVFFDL